MNIYKAEMFRYRKSFYSKIAFAGTILLAVLTAGFLYYTSHGVSKEFLQAMGLAEEAVQAMKENLYGIRYIATALSSAELLMILAGFPVVIHVCNDYHQGTLRYEQQNSKSRTGCYLARSLAAGSFGILLLWEYSVASGLIALFFFGGQITVQDIGKVLFILLLESVIVMAFVVVLYLLCELIRHQILAMAVLILLVLLFTPGIEMLFELFDCRYICKSIWIGSMTTALSDFVLDVPSALQLLAVSLLYMVLASLIGILVYKNRRIL